MQPVMAIEISDHSAEVLEAMKEQVILGLESIGQEAQGYAKEECPVDTGRLRNSIAHKVVNDEKSVYVGTNVEYGVYVEYGTGKYAENGHGRQTPWFYVDDKGQGHWTSGMKPRHFLKKALADHDTFYKAILEAALKS